MSNAKNSVQGSVVSIHVADGAGQAIREPSEAELVAGRGIAGDRYHAGVGKFSPDPMDPDHELTLIAIEAIEAFNARTGHSMAPGDFRRNIVTRGIDLDALAGVEFRMGEAVIQGIRPCDPCAYLARRTEREVIPYLVGHGGLRAGIVRGGTLRIGDTITVAVPD